MPDNCYGSPDHIGKNQQHRYLPNTQIAQVPMKVHGQFISTQYKNYQTFPGLRTQNVVPIMVLD